jgi:hypothetical protein
MTVKSRTAHASDSEWSELLLGLIQSHGFEPAMWPTLVRSD